MRVLLCCFSRPVVQMDGPYRMWVPAFREGLEACGCEVLEPRTVDLLEPFLRRNDEAWLKSNRIRLAEKLLEEVKALHRRKPLDLILTYLWAFQIDPAGMRAVTDRGIPTVNFFCDNVRDFDSVAPLTKSFSLNWVPEAGALELYRRIGAPRIHLPMAASPSRFPYQERPECSRVIFLGSADALRGHLLLQVRDRLPLKVGGKGWGTADGGPKETPAPPHDWFDRWLAMAATHGERLLRYGLAGEWRYFQHRSIARRIRGAFDDRLVETGAYEQMVEHFWRSAVTLGINRVPTPAAPLASPRTYSRMRDVEAPMAGAAYLTEWAEDLPQLFDLEKEVLVYRQADDLVGQAERLLKDPALRKSLRANGRKRCLAHHTWQHRFEALFHHLGLGQRGACDG